MKSTVLASSLVLALGVVAASLVGPSPPAAAAPSVSPFAGTYGSTPDTSYGWTISISKTGSIQGKFSGYYMTGSMSGDVTDAGDLSVHGSMKNSYPYDGEGRPVKGSTITKFDYHALVYLDADGNIIGAPDTGIWYRK